MTDTARPTYWSATLSHIRQHGVILAEVGNGTFGGYTWEQNSNYPVANFDRH